jgi:hypothetical protein
MRQTRILAMLAALLLAGGLACSGSASGGRFVYEVQDGVAASDARLVKREIDAARRYYEKQLGVRMQLDWKVRLTPSNLFYVGTVGSSVTFQMGDSFWREADPVDIQLLVGHEVFHVFQADLNGSFSLGPKGGPSWLLEGTAEYAAVRYVADRNGIEFDDLVSLLRLSYAGATLTNNSVVDEDDYVAALLAIRRLVGDDGFDVIHAYFAELSGTIWTEAFRKHFGTDPETFIKSLAPAATND